MFSWVDLTWLFLPCMVKHDNLFVKADVNDVTSMILDCCGMIETSDFPWETLVNIFRRIFILFLEKVSRHYTISFLIKNLLIL